MTNSTPSAGYPAPKEPGTHCPPLELHQRKHMRIQHIDGTRVLTWYYKVVISTQHGAKTTVHDAIYTIAMALHENYNDINIVNLSNNTIATEDEVNDLITDPSNPYYAHLHTNHTTSTTTFLIKLRTNLPDTYHDFRDPLGHLQVRLDKSLRFVFDEFLGVPTKLVGAILNTPHNQIHRDRLSRVISAELPLQVKDNNPIIKASLTSLSFLKDGKRSSTTVVGIFAPVNIAGEVGGTVRKVLLNDDHNIQCGLGKGHFFSSKDLQRGPDRDNAITLHLKLIENQTTVNLYRLELHNLNDDISPEICNELLSTTHKSSKIITSKLDLLQAFFSNEFQATTATVSSFYDKRGKPKLHVNTTKQQVHLIYEALHSLDSSPLRVHFFRNSIYHALPPEARDFLATADTPQERLSMQQAANKLLRNLQKPRPTPLPTTTKHHRPPSINPPSYATAVKPPTTTPPNQPSDRRIQELENKVATLSRKVEAQSSHISTLTNTIEKLMTQIDRDAPPLERTKLQDDDDVSMTGLNKVYGAMDEYFQMQTDTLTKAIKDTVAQVENFSPLQNERRTQEWGEYLATIILALLHEPHSELTEEARSNLNRQFLEIPPHLATSLKSEPLSTSPPPPERKPVSSPEIIDISHDSPTNATTESPPSSPTASPLEDSPTEAHQGTALVPLQKQPDTNMKSNIPTNKSQASSTPRLFLPNIKTKINKSKINADITKYFRARSEDASTKSADSSADLAD